MHKYLKKYKNESFLVKKIIFVILSMLGFFIGRVSVFHMLNPIAISYLGCFLFKGKIFNFALCFTLLGFLSKINSFYITKYIICLFILFFLNIIFSIKNIKENIMTKSVFATLSIFVSGLVICFLNEFSLYYFVLSILESLLTFCMCFILNKGIEYVQKENKSILTNEEIISISVFIGCVICGSADVVVGEISFTYFFIITLLLFVSYLYGSSVGAIVSLLSSFLLFITGNINPSLIVVLSLCTILSSLVREKGKFFVAFVFSITMCTLCFVIDSYLINNILIFSTISSNILFLAIPLKHYDNLYNIAKGEVATTYAEKMQILTSDKLNKYANSFEKLSKTFYNLSEKKTNLDQQDISNLIDEVATKVCNSCDMKCFCWEKNFYSTYQNIFSILNMYEKTGQVEKTVYQKIFLKIV